MASVQAEHVVSGEEMATPEGIYHAVRFVVQFCDCEPAIVTALASLMCDYLRTAPADVRGQVADHVCELIRHDVRASLQ